jgi:peptide deformylase
MIKPVLRMGNPRLYQPSVEVIHFETEELSQLIDDMWDTMTEQKGAGISAPQIDVFLRVVIFGAASSRYPQAKDVPQTILINPKIHILDDNTEEYFEGCLSVPGLRGLVRRPSYIAYEGFDQQGRRIEREASGFHARVVQHEVDHLDGILFPMRLENVNLLYCESEVDMTALHKAALIE